MKVRKILFSTALGLSMIAAPTMAMATESTPTTTDEVVVSEEVTTFADETAQSGEEAESPLTITSATEYEISGTATPGNYIFFYEGDLDYGNTVVEEDGTWSYTWPVAKEVGTTVIVKERATQDQDGDVIATIEAVLTDSEPAQSGGEEEGAQSGGEEGAQSGGEEAQSGGEATTGTGDQGSQLAKTGANLPLVLTLGTAGTALTAAAVLSRRNTLGLRSE